MDKNTKPQSNTDKTSTPKTYLSSENPDVLKNLDIKTNISNSPKAQQQTAEENTLQEINTSFGYSSPYADHQPIQSNQPQVATPQVFQPPVGEMSGIPEQNVLPTQPLQQKPNFPFGQNYDATKYQMPTQNPLQPQQEVIYKEVESNKSGIGSTVFGSIFKQIFNCVGCVLLLIVVIAGVAIYVINF